VALRIPGVTLAAAAMLVLLVAQVVIGILNVVWLLPLWLATLHNFGAALLLCSVVMLKFMVTCPVGAGIGAGSTAAGGISASRSAGAAHA
jgi:heme A synthase